MVSVPHFISLSLFTDGHIHRDQMKFYFHVYHWGDCVRQGPWTVTEHNARPCFNSCKSVSFCEDRHNALNVYPWKNEIAVSPWIWIRHFSLSLLLSCLLLFTQFLHVFAQFVQDSGLLSTRSVTALPTTRK